MRAFPIALYLTFALTEPQKLPPNPSSANVGRNLSLFSSTLLYLDLNQAAGNGGILLIHRRRIRLVVICGEVKSRLCSRQQQLTPHLCERSKLHTLE
jgi:hypothetical protein